MAGSASEALLVGLGAIPGAWLRLKVVNHFQPMVPKKHWGTFIVNVVACFALGLVLALNETCAASTGIALLMGVGFFGSLSTFSTFAVELLNELRAGQTLTAVVLALASIGAGLLAGLPAAPRRQLLLGIGFCGSLTTFSSWMLAAMKHLSSCDWAAALGLIGLTLGLGLGAAALGFSLGRRLKPPAPPQSPI